MVAPFQKGVVIVNLISSVRHSKARPVVERTCSPCDFVEAHGNFLAREHTGNLLSVRQLIAP